MACSVVLRYEKMIDQGTKPGWDSLAFGIVTKAHAILWVEG